eukprot:scaffold677605_cov45-Prasinocladus_malaysianus.AAC.1
MSDCGTGVRKHISYEFVFDDQTAAERFRDWLKPNESNALLGPLLQLDPAGVCAAKGETSKATQEERCVLADAKHGF